MATCECGCGQDPGPYKSRAANLKGKTKRFVSGHNSRVAHPMEGRAHTDEAKTKIKAARAEQTNVGGPSAGFRGDPIDRFFDKVSIDPGCWEWTGATSSNGYGQFHDEDQTIVQAHRWVYENSVGLIPEGLELDHLCRNRRCVNPDHLEPVTHAVNVRRAYR